MGEQLWEVGIPQPNFGKAVSERKLRSATLGVLRSRISQPNNGNSVAEIEFQNDDGGGKIAGR